MAREAVCTGDLKLLQEHIQSGANVNEPCTEVGWSGSLLMLAIKKGYQDIVLALLLAGADVHGTDNKGWTALHWACHKGLVEVVEALIERGSQVNVRSRFGVRRLDAVIMGSFTDLYIFSSGSTPLMVAAHAYECNDEVVKKLILAGAKVGMQNATGNTALHHAAAHNHIHCGILLAEAGASVRTWNKYFIPKTPLDFARTEFRKTINQSLSFTTRKALCIIGNAEGGKSTLIAALQAESNSFLGKVVNQFKEVTDHRQRTAGIETIFHCSQRYGKVLFFDFAGQHEYHGPHQMFLELLLSKPGISMTLLLVVKMTEEEEAILHQLHRWLSPVALMSTTANPPRVIVIGSFLDKVKFKQEAAAKVTRCIKTTKKDFKELPLEFVGSCFLNCRQPQSDGIDQLCHFLQEIPIPEFRATHTQYSLAWVLSRIRSSFSRQAVQLQEFSTWVQHNKNNLLWTMPTPEEVCQDLSAAGYALYLPNKEDPLKSWLVLDLPSILRDVYGTLFSQSKEIVDEFGLLHCQHLAELFPYLDLEMVQQLLISLEFCIPVDPAVLKVEVGRLTQSEETSGWLFFPALISAKPPKPNLNSLPQTAAHRLCWQLRTSEKHSISARVLQTILLRLAARFVEQRSKGSTQQYYGNIWSKGIAWQSTVGVDVTVHITDRVIQVIGACFSAADKSSRYLTNVIADIISTVHRLSPKLAADSYILHPSVAASSSEAITDPPTKELFPLAGIQDAIRDGKEFTFSLKDSENHWNMTRVSDLFGGYVPSLEDIERINWTQLEPSQLELHTEGNGTCTHSKPTPMRSGARALLDISSTPDMRDVDELVVTAVASNWQRLALRLGLEVCVSEVVLKNHPNDCEGACRDMFDRWLRRERHTGEEERTWSTLLTALGRAGFVELERSLPIQRSH